METKGVSSAIISAVRVGVVEQLSSIAKHPFDGARIQDVEKQFIETLGKSGASGLSELFSQNDERVKTIVHDGQKHYRKFLALGRYLTLLGEISLKRGIFQSNQANRSICPLEAKLKFINDYVSFAAAEYICYSLASMTLKEFVKHCEKWTLMKPSEGTAKRVLEYVGDFLKTSGFLDTIQSKQAVSKQAVSLAMSMDSTSVLIRKEGWRHATAATVSTYDAEGNRLDTVYIGRMPEKGKTQAKRLLEKEVEAITKKNEFKHIVCIADGARDLWQFFRKKYPDAIHVVDFFHVCEHLSKLSELFFRDSSDAKTWYKKHRALLKEDPDGASKVIRAVRYRRSKTKEKPEIEAELKYLQRNRKKMNYFELRQNNLPIGSGVVEAACKNLIGARMKKSGMRWTIDGGQTVLTLRSLILSNRWEHFWSFFVNRHFPEFGT
ncbi:MAG: transposase [Bacteroidales bacterium]|nr:transposase [Bacteroidales bacterium]